VGTRQDVFSEIYERNAWNGAHGVGAGPGSSPVATERIAMTLPVWCEELEVRSVVDAGCGDGLWQPTLPGYYGVDIVPDVIERCKERFPWRRYEVLDFVSQVLPSCNAVLCRDALQHLPLADCEQALNNFREAGATVLFASSHRGHANRDIAAGDWYPVNLEAPPFSLGEPLRELPDNLWPGGPSPWPGKVFGAWSL
jgi:SAM-dependent methyltransferase